MQLLRAGTPGRRPSWLKRVRQVALVALVVAYCIGTVVAQNNNNNNDNNNNANNNNNAPAPADNQPQPSANQPANNQPPANSNQPAASNNNNNQPSASNNNNNNNQPSASNNNPAPSPQPTNPSASPSNNNGPSSGRNGNSRPNITPTGPQVTITGSSQSGNSADGPKPTLAPSQSAVQITAVNPNNAQPSDGGPPRLPTLSNTGVPVPTVTVPSNSNNPFMSQSKLPEGTVFIAVGAILGGVAAAVFAWHLALAFLHKRSLKKFANANNMGYTATPLMADNKDFYGNTYGAQGYGAALAAGRGGSALPQDMKTTMDSSHDRSSRMINSGLFFSPTAEVMNSAVNPTNDSLTSTMGSTAGVGIATNNRSTPRASVYMPAGYYSGNQGGAPSVMSGGRSVRHMSMSNISMNGGPYSGGGAPSIAASLKIPGNPRMSQVSGDHRESVRAPSAYLDDFLGADK